MTKKLNWRKLIHLNIFKTLTDDINFNIQLPICLHNWNPPPSPLIMGRLSFWKLAKIRGGGGGGGRGGSCFFHKKWRSWQNMEDCFKKEGVSLIFILTKPFQCHLSMSVWCACVCFLCLYLLYQYSLCFMART